VCAIIFLAPGEIPENEQGMSEKPYKLIDYSVGYQGKVLAEAESSNRLSPLAKRLVQGELFVRDTPGAHRVVEVLMLGPEGFTARHYAFRYIGLPYPYKEPCINWDSPDVKKRCCNPKGPWRKPRNWHGIRKDRLERCRSCFLRDGTQSSADFLASYNHEHNPTRKRGRNKTPA
jgi:hypothetical protein